MHTLLCACPPSVESPLTLVMLKSRNQIPPAFKVWFSRNSSSHCWTLRLGSLTWGSEPSLQWVDFCGISVLQFMSHPPSSLGIWFYCDCAPPTILLRLLPCPWMWTIFLVSSTVLLSMIVQQLVVIPVCSRNLYPLIQKFHHENLLLRNCERYKKISMQRISLQHEL